MNIKIATLELLTVALLKGVHCDVVEEFKSKLSEHVKLDGVTKSIEGAFEKCSGQLTSLEENKAKDYTKREEAFKKQEEELQKMIMKPLDDCAEGLSKFEPEVAERLSVVDPSKPLPFVYLQKGKECLALWRDKMQPKLQVFSDFDSKNKPEFERMVNGFESKSDEIKKDLENKIEGVEKSLKSAQAKIEQKIKTIGDSAKAFYRQFSQGKTLKSEEKTAMMEAVSEYSKNSTSMTEEYRKKFSEGTETLKQMKEEINKDFKMDEEIKGLRENWKKRFVSTSEIMKRFKSNLSYARLMFTTLSTGLEIKPHTIKTLKDQAASDLLKTYASAFSSDFSFDGMAAKSEGDKPATSASAAQEAEKSGYSWLVIGGVAALVIVVVGVIIYFATAGSSSK